MHKYLVTGGAGFIGSHLCDELIKKNTVYVLDNLSTGKKENLPKGVQFIEGDIRDYDLVKDLMSQVDGCFHLAAVVSIPQFNEFMLDANQVNTTGTLNILHNAFSASKQTVPVIFTSSSGVYGDSLELPLDETVVPLPLSMYAASKLAGEYYGRFIHEIYKVPFTVLRLFNIYGPRQDLNSSYSGVISIFLNAIMHDKPCILYGDGLQTRDFVYVKDAVRFFIQAMNKVKTKSNIYNVCTGKEVSILKMGEMLSAIMKKDYTVEYRPPRIGDMRYCRGCPQLAASELEVKTQISLELGLKKLVISTHEGRQ